MVDGQLSPRRTFKAMIPAESWQRLLERSNRVRVRSGQHLVSQGMQGTSVYLLERARAQVIHTNSDGATLLLGLNGPGDLVGEMAAFRSGIRSATVSALERGEVFQLPAPEFQRIITSHRLETYLQSYLIGKQDSSDLAHVDAVHGSVGQRIARLLLALIELDPPDDPTRIRVPIRQSQLVEALGLSRSAISQGIARLRANGVLTDERQLVVKNLRVLRTACGFP